MARYIGNGARGHTLRDAQAHGARGGRRAERHAALAARAAAGILLLWKLLCMHTRELTVRGAGAAEPSHEHRGRAAGLPFHVQSRRSRARAADVAAHVFHDLGVRMS